jgi:hypothetical protein
MIFLPNNFLKGLVLGLMRILKMKIARALTLMAADIELSVKRASS